MKIAALSDIHGNIAALDAVLADIATRAIDVTVNLGDICSGPLFPAETAQRLMALDLPTVRGNHERQVLDGRIERMGASDAHAAQTMTAEQIAWFASLPETLQLTPDVLMVHGTAHSDVVHFLHTVDEQGIHSASEAEVAARAQGTDAAIILCGHTHIPGQVRLSDGRTVINPGSVGLQAYDDDHPCAYRVEMGSPHARYAVIETQGADCTVEFVAVPYDWDGAAQTAEARGRSDWVNALRTGRM
ncbi:MAG: metallophosphoesterase family protein [Novosphingobium sp.]